jgi:hypothetical protein
MAAPQPAPPAPAPAAAPPAAAQPPAAQEAVARPAAAPSVPTQPAVTPVRADTRVHARTNSWIELRGPDGDVLAQTYVRAGETYVVPAGISYRIIDAR